MYACETCGEEFETLSALRIEHDPCPVEAARRRREAAAEALREERGIEVGERCRHLRTGEEVRVVDVEPGDDGPVVVWVPADAEDTPDNRSRGSMSDVV